MVQTIKHLLKWSEDPHLALLSYRATPHPWCKLSPAELCMGRRLRTPVPVTTKQLVPKWSHISPFKQINAEFKEKQRNFDHHHQVHKLPLLLNHTNVWIETDGEPIPGQVISPAGTPRSYHIQMPTGQICRNRSDLKPTPDSIAPADEPVSPLARMATRLQTGTTIRPPSRYIEEGEM